MTLLSNVQDVCLELGLQSPVAVVSATDTTTKQVLALMNRVGRMLSTETDWQALAKEHRFQTVYYEYTGDVTAGSTTVSNLSSVVGLSTDFMVSGAGIPDDHSITAVGATDITLSVPATATGTGVALTFGKVKYSMPADYDRIINNTSYQATTWSLEGPRSAQEWQALKNWGSSSQLYSFRILGNKFAIWPMPSTAETLGFEYVSKYWAVSAAGVAKEKFTADDDTSYFPESLLILGAKLKFFEAKGFDTTTLLSDFVREYSKYKGSEAGAKTICLNKREQVAIPSVPDTGYGA